MNTIANHLKHENNAGFFAPLFRKIFVSALKAWFNTWNRVEVYGAENLPQGEPYIIAANHCSHLDALAMMAVFPLNRSGEIYMAAAADYFFNTPGRSAFSKIALNAVPVERRAGRSGALSVAARVLSGGSNVLVVFPEGTRGNGREIREFKGGLGVLAASMGRRVVPAYIEGTGDKLPKGALVPRMGGIKISFGEPLSFDMCEADKETAREIACWVRENVVQLKKER